ncbi:MAG: hypothetical protein ACRENP_10965 [Longimicrobiales bacterium]
MDRRGFLRASAGGGTAIVLASLLPAGCARDYPQAAEDGVALKSLTPKEYATARAAAEVLLEGAPVAARRVVERIDAELLTTGEPIRQDFKTVLGLIEHLTPLGGRVRRFTALNPAERMKYLRGWSRSRFKLRRGAFFALKAFINYFAYIDASTRPLTGFQGPWPERVKIAVRPVDFGPVS